MMPSTRQKQKSEKTRHIISVPVTPEQLAELDARAGRRPLSAYVRERLFAANDNAVPARTACRKRTGKVESALADVLAQLGPAAHALRSLTHGIVSGIVPVSPDTEAAILKACADIAEMKAQLMKALGIRER